MTQAGPAAGPGAAPAALVAALVDRGVAGRIAAGDLSLWPAPAGWTGWPAAPRQARPLVGAVAATADRLRVAGLHRLLLITAAGAGVATRALLGEGPGPVLLDGTDPEAVRDALAGDLDRTALVTVLPPDTGSAERNGVAMVHRVVGAALRTEGIDPDERTVLVTAPQDGFTGAPDGHGGATVLTGPPDVAGLWASLTGYALVPAGLAGVDVGGLLAGAATAADALAADRADNPALRLAALLAGAPAVALTGSPALAEWVTELVAGGLGKDGRGPLPVRPDPTDPTAGRPLPAGTVLVELAAPDDDATADLRPTTDRSGRPAHRCTGGTAAQVLLWQRAVAAAAHLLEVSPAHRPGHPGPDEGTVGPGAGPGSGITPPPGDPADALTDGFVDGVVSVHGGDWLPDSARTVADALRALVDPTGPAPTRLSVQAYLDPDSDASAAVLRAELARRTGLVTTFGWAPRCLAGTGQYDRAGPDGPLVCQLTGAAEEEPGHGPEELGGQQYAVAAAEAAALAGRGRRVLRLHLSDRLAGLVAVARAVQELDLPAHRDRS